MEPTGDGDSSSKEVLKPISEKIVPMEDALQRMEKLVAETQSRMLRLGITPSSHASSDDLAKNTEKEVSKVEELHLERETNSDQHVVGSISSSDVYKEQLASQDHNFTETLSNEIFEGIKSSGVIETFQEESKEAFISCAEEFDNNDESFETAKSFSAGVETDSNISDEVMAEMPKFVKAVVDSSTDINVTENDSEEHTSYSESKEFLDCEVIGTTDVNANVLSNQGVEIEKLNMCVDVTVSCSTDHDCEGKVGPMTVNPAEILSQENSKSVVSHAQGDNGILRIFPVEDIKVMEISQSTAEIVEVSSSTDIELFQANAGGDFEKHGYSNDDETDLILNDNDETLSAQTSDDDTEIVQSSNGYESDAGSSDNIVLELYSKNDNEKVPQFNGFEQINKKISSNDVESKSVSPNMDVKDSCPSVKNLKIQSVDTEIALSGQNVRNAEVLVSHATTTIPEGVEKGESLDEENIVEGNTTSKTDFKPMPALDDTCSRNVTEFNVTGSSFIQFLSDVSFVISHNGSDKKLSDVKTSNDEDNINGKYEENCSLAKESDREVQSEHTDKESPKKDAINDQILYWPEDNESPTVGNNYNRDYPNDKTDPLFSNGYYLRALIKSRSGEEEILSMHDAGGTFPAGTDDYDDHQLCVDDTRESTTLHDTDPSGKDTDENVFVPNKFQSEKSSVSEMYPKLDTSSEMTNSTDIHAEAGGTGFEDLSDKLSATEIIIADESCESDLNLAVGKNNSNESLITPDTNDKDAISAKVVKSLALLKDDFLNITDTLLQVDNDAIKEIVVDGVARDEICPVKEQEIGETAELSSPIPIMSEGKLIEDADKIVLIEDTAERDVSSVEVQGEEKSPALDEVNEPPDAAPRKIHNTEDSAQSLDVAAAGGNYEMVAHLLESGEEATLKSLLAAVRGNFILIFDLLFAKRVVKNVCDAREVLFMARSAHVASAVLKAWPTAMKGKEAIGLLVAAACHEDVLNVFMSAGGKLNLEAALCQVLRSGNTQCFTSLLNEMCDVNSVICCGQTLLHLAAEYDAAECILALLHHGADIGCTDRNGNTSIERAIALDNKRAIQILSDAGAISNLLNKFESKKVFVCCPNFRKIKNVL